MLLLLGKVAKEKLGIVGYSKTGEIAMESEFEKKASIASLPYYDITGYF